MRKTRLREQLAQPLSLAAQGIIQAKVVIFSNHVWILVSLYQQRIMAAQKKIFYANKKYKGKEPFFQPFSLAKETRKGYQENLFSFSQYPVSLAGRKIQESIGGWKRYQPYTSFFSFCTPLDYKSTGEKA